MDTQVIEFLRSRGLNVIKEDIDGKIEVWKSWYKGHVDTFHTYSVYTGKSQKRQLNRKTLNMAARICQDWANKLLNEKVEIKVSDEYTQEILNKLVKQVNFYVRGNNLLEAAFAIGGGFLIQYWDGEKVNQKYVLQDMMYPITFDSGVITEAAFSSEKTIKGKKYVYLETHTKDENGFYCIENYLLEKSENDIKEVPDSFYEEIELDTYVSTCSSTPTFQQIRPNVANKNKFDSPYGTSVFSGAIDVLKAVDIVFDSYIKEIVLGKKRIFAHDSVTNVRLNENGDSIRVFDPNDEVFYLLQGIENESAPPIIESNMTLRVNEHNLALQTFLNLLSEAVGFGANAYKWDNSNVSTATQIISENSEMFRSLKKHEIILTEAVVNMAKSLLNLEALYNNDSKIKLDATITVNFDDSIIEDTSEIKRQAMLELNNGLIDAIEYYMRVYKMDEAQATEFYNKLLGRIPKPEEEPEGT